MQIFVQGFLIVTVIRAAVVMLVVASCASCQRTPPAVESEMGSGEGSAAEGSGAVVPEAPPVAALDDAALMAMEMPSIEAAQQRCETDAECRVWQPSDWSASVECCYEYPCDLGYLAVNRATWSLLRAWQRLHPYDCAAHLRDNGPCSSRPVRCGLMQEPPSAECVDGLCRVAWPEPWPAPDSDAQTCTVSTDCRPWRVSSTTEASRCCEADCATTWTAINAETRAELDAWLAEHPVDCDAVLTSGVCAGREACVVPAPDVMCVAGLCAVR